MATSFDVSLFVVAHILECVRICELQGKVHTVRLAQFHERCGLGLSGEVGWRWRHQGRCCWTERQPPCWLLDCLSWLQSPLVTEAHLTGATAQLRSGFAQRLLTR